MIPSKSNLKVESCALVSTVPENTMPAVKEEKQVNSLTKGNTHEPQHWWAWQDNHVDTRSGTHILVTNSRLSGFKAHSTRGKTVLVLEI